MRALAICSGGLDSVTMAHSLAAKSELAAILSFDYGQRHRKELQFAKQCADDLNVDYFHLPLDSLAALLPGSALTDTSNVDVPHGHYAADNMKQTIVPNRNAIFLSLAYGLAAAHGFDAVGAAFHGGDHFIYPDCRPDFVSSFAAMQQHSLAGFAEIEMHTPYLNMTKAQIVEHGARLKVPYQKTWSCYEGGELHCGRCGTCVERQEAFATAGVVDPTEYKDSSYWAEAIKSHKAGNLED